MAKKAKSNGKTAKAGLPKSKDNVVSTFKKEGTALGESIVNSSGKTTKGVVDKKKPAPKKSPPVKKFLVKSQYQYAPKRHHVDIVSSWVTVDGGPVWSLQVRISTPCH